MFAMNLPQPIRPDRSSAKQVILLILAEFRCDLLESVPQDVVAYGLLLDGKVTFEHAAIGAEVFNGVQVVGPLNVGDFIRGRRQVSFFPPKPVYPLCEAPEFCEDVGALAEG